jgi:hypothetical protein
MTSQGFPPAPLPVASNPAAFASVTPCSALQIAWQHRQIDRNTTAL